MLPHIWLIQLPIWIMQKVIMDFRFIKFLKIMSDLIHIMRVVSFNILVVVLNDENVLFGSQQPKHSNKVTKIKD